MKIQVGYDIEFEFPAPTEMLETTIMLKPEYVPGRWFGVKRNPEWRPGMTVTVHVPNPQ